MVLVSLILTTSTAVAQVTATTTTTTTLPATVSGPLPLTGQSTGTVLAVVAMLLVAALTANELRRQIWR